MGSKKKKTIRRGPSLKNSASEISPESLLPSTPGSSVNSGGRSERLRTADGRDLGSVMWPNADSPLAGRPVLAASRPDDLCEGRAFSVCWRDPDGQPAAGICFPRPDVEVVTAGVVDGEIVVTVVYLGGASVVTFPLGGGPRSPAGPSQN